MAQIFKDINALLGDEQQKRGQDVLGGNGQSAAQQNNPELPGFNPQQPTTIPGQNVGTAGSVQGDSGQKGNAPQANQADLLSASNINAAKNNSQVGATESQAISQAKAELGNRFKGWSENANKTADNFSIGNDVVDKAISGDASNFSQLQNRLGRAYGGTGNFNADFRQQDLSDFADKNAIGAKTFADRNQTLGGSYTQGQFNLDKALENQAGAMDFSKLFAENEGLANQYKDYQNQADEINKNQESKYNAQTEALKAALRDKIGKLQEQQQQEFDADSAQYSSDLQTKKDDLLNKQLAWLDERTKAASGIDPQGKAWSHREEALSKLKEIEQAIRSGKFVRAQEPSRDVNQYWNEEEASQFNRIMELLGQGDRQTAGTGGGRANVVDDGWGAAVGDYMGWLNSLPPDVTPAGEAPPTTTDKVIDAAKELPAKVDPTTDEGRNNIATIATGGGNILADKVLGNDLALPGKINDMANSLAKKDDVIDAFNKGRTVGGGFSGSIPNDNGAKNDTPTPKLPPLTNSALDAVAKFDPTTKNGKDNIASVATGGLNKALPYVDPTTSKGKDNLTTIATGGLTKIADAGGKAIDNLLNGGGKGNKVETPTTTTSSAGSGANFGGPTVPGDMFGKWNPTIKPKGSSSPSIPSSNPAQPAQPTTPTTVIAPNGTAIDLGGPGKINSNNPIGSLRSK